MMSCVLALRCKRLAAAVIHGRHTPVQHHAAESHLPLMSSQNFDLFRASVV